MILVPEHARRARLGLLLFLLGFGYLTVAPVGFLTTPLAAMSLVARDSSRRTLFIGSFVGGVSLWWLLTTGNPADQVVRAAGLVAAIVFVAMTVRTRLSLVHRSLSTVVISGALVAFTVRVVGPSVREITWWLEQRGAMAQAYLGQFWYAGRVGQLGSDTSDRTDQQLEAILQTVPDLIVNLFPAILALQMMAGFALATYMATRLSIATGATAPGAFRDFHFSEHLGWIAVLAMAIVLFGESPALRITSVNLLVVAGTLYGLRGLAVGWFIFERRRRRGFLLGTLIVLSFVLLWRVMIPAIIVVGVVDTGLNIRKRLIQRGEPNRWK